MRRQTELIHNFNSILNTYQAEINQLTDNLIKLHNRLIENEVMIITLFNLCSEMHRRYREDCSDCKYKKLCDEYNKK